MVIGVDIGARGGLAGYDGDAWRTAQASPRAELWSIARQWVRDHPGAVWYVEAPLLLQSHGRRSSHAIGNQLGRLDVVLDGCKRFDVHPSRWQAALGLTNKRGDRKSHKANLRAAAERLVGRPLGEGEADAVLIAYYGYGLVKPQRVNG